MDLVLASFPLSPILSTEILLPPHIHQYVGQDHNTDLHAISQLGSTMFADLELRIDTARVRNCLNDSMNKTQLSHDFQICRDNISTAASSHLYLQPLVRSCNNAERDSLVALLKKLQRLAVIIDPEFVVPYQRRSESQVARVV
jgi:hypothetical protein